MNETKEMITEAVEKVGMRAILFLDSFNKDARKEIISAAAHERSEEGMQLDLNAAFGDEEISLEVFAAEIAERIQKAGTREWILSLTKETAESTVNSLNAAGDCKIALGNGRQLDAQELEVMWKFLHEEDSEREE